MLFLLNIQENRTVLKVNILFFITLGHFSSVTMSLGLQFLAPEEATM